MKPNEFRCDHCGGVFLKGWSDEDANAEARDNWSVEQASERPDMAVICDDCYKAFMTWVQQGESEA